jgi:hypothetical protein
MPVTSQATKNPPTSALPSTTSFSLCILEKTASEEVPTAVIQCIQKVVVHVGVWVAISRRRIVGPWTSLPTPFIRVHNFPNADLQKVFANKIKRVQACIDARGHHFQHLL